MSVRPRLSASEEALREPFDAPLRAPFVNPGPNDHGNVPQLLAVLTRGDRGHVDVREAFALNLALAPRWCLVMCGGEIDARRIAEFAWRAGLRNVFTADMSCDIASDLSRFQAHKQIPRLLVSTKATQIASQRNSVLRIATWMNAGVVLLADDDLRVHPSTAKDATRLCYRYPVVSIPSVADLGKPDKSVLFHVDTEVNHKNPSPGSTASLEVLNVREYHEHFPLGINGEDHIHQLMAWHQQSLALHGGAGQFPYDEHAHDRAFHEVFGELAIAALVAANRQAGPTDDFVLPTRDQWAEARASMTAFTRALESSLARWTYGAGPPGAWRDTRADAILGSLDRSLDALALATSDPLSRWADIWWHVDRPNWVRELDHIAAEGIAGRRMKGDPLANALAHVCPGAAVFRVVDDGVQQILSDRAPSLVRMTAPVRPSMSRLDSDCSRGLDAALSGEELTDDGLVAAVVQAWEFAIGQCGMEAGADARLLAEQQTAAALGLAAQQMRSLAWPTPDQLTADPRSLIKPGGFDPDLAEPPAATMIGERSMALIRAVEKWPHDEQRKLMQALIRIAGIPPGARNAIVHTLASCIPGETPHPALHVMRAITSPASDPTRCVLPQLLFGQSPGGAALADAWAQARSSRALLDDLCSQLWPARHEAEIASEILRSSVDGRLSESRAVALVDGLRRSPPSELVARLTPTMRSVDGEDPSGRDAAPCVMHLPAWDSVVRAHGPWRLARLRAQIHHLDPDDLRHFVPEGLLKYDINRFWCIREYPHDLSQAWKGGAFSPSGVAVAILTRYLWAGLESGNNLESIGFIDHPDQWARVTECLCRHATRPPTWSAPAFTDVSTLAQIGQGTRIAPCMPDSHAWFKEQSDRGTRLHVALGLATQIDICERSLVDVAATERSSMQEALLRDHHTAFTGLSTDSQRRFEFFLAELDAALGRARETIGQYATNLGYLDQQFNRSRWGGRLHSTRVSQAEARTVFAVAWAIRHTDERSAAEILRGLMDGQNREPVDLAATAPDRFPRIRSITPELWPRWCSASARPLRQHETAMARPADPNLLTLTPVSAMRWPANPSGPVGRSTPAVRNISGA